MSHRAFQEVWDAADHEVRDLLDLEITEDPLLLPEKGNVESQLNHLSCLFVKYALIFNKVTEAYDQIVHPQKRRVLKLLVDGVTGRLLELKHALVELDSSNYHFFDALLADLKLTPQDIRIKVPAYYRSENMRAIKERERILESMDAKVAGEARKEEEKKSEEKESISVEDAIALIQRHERARQGRVRARLMQGIRERERRERLMAAQKIVKESLDPNLAAVIIQTNFRRILAKKKVEEMRRHENMLIGMVKPPNKRKKDNPVFKAKKIAEERREVQAQYEVAYQAALKNTKQKIADVEGPDMRENMSDRIREWFLSCREQTGKFPDYPSAEDGGSNLIFNPPPPNPDGEEEATSKKGKGKGKGKKKSAKGGKKSAKKDKKADKKKKKDGDEEEEDKGPKLSVYRPMLDEASNQFKAAWKANEKDSHNITQKHDPDMIKEIKRKEVEEELRLHVDELMREELKNLKAAVDGAKKGKGKKGKGKGKKKKKGKKGKKGKGKKGKKDKDITAGIAPEALYTELVKNGIVQRVPAVTFDDIIGTYSFLGTATLAKKADPTPSMEDVRRVLTQFCVLPLGSQSVHETQPVHVKSVLLTGAHGTGKKALARACAYELGANFFDLSPSNTAGLYTAKKGVDGVEGMLNKTFKLAKLYQPSVIYIGNGANIFLKKKPKDDPFDCTRMKKELPKYIKSLKLGDRVVVIGCDNNPFEADTKGLLSVFQRVLYVPRPDYGSRLALWEKELRVSRVMQHREQDLSVLAKISDGYTASDISYAVQSAITPMRKKQQVFKPVRPAEFVPFLAECEPVYVEEEKQFMDWYADKIPLGKKRKTFLSGGGGEDNEGDAKKKKKGKGKKKKK